MNQETIDKYKEIIANAPEGATHWGADTYLKIDDWYCRTYLGMGEWSQAASQSAAVIDTAEIFVRDNPKNLSLIKDIVELWEARLC